MGRKGDRRLPAWYLDAVNMARDVFAENPDAVDTSRPHIDPKPNSGIGLQSTRTWRAPAVGGARNGLRPPPPSTPLWAPPDADADTPDKRTPVQLDVDVVREIDNGR